MNVDEYAVKEFAERRPQADGRHMAPGKHCILPSAPRTCAKSRRFANPISQEQRFSLHLTGFGWSLIRWLVLIQGAAHGEYVGVVLQEPLDL